MALTFSNYYKNPPWLRDIMQAYSVAQCEVFRDGGTWSHWLCWVDANGETQRMELPDNARFSENFWNLLHVRLRLTQGEMVPQ